MLNRDLNPKETAKRQLRIYGWLLLVLGMIDLLLSVLDLYISGNLLEGLNRGEMIFIIALYVLFFCVILSKFWMARQAFRYAKGVGTGKSHITLAKIGIGFLIFTLVLSAISIVTGNGVDTDSTFSNLSSLCVLWFYLGAAKTCLN